MNPIVALIRNLFVALAITVMAIVLGGLIFTPLVAMAALLDHPLQRDLLPIAVPLLLASFGVLLMGGAKVESGPFAVFSNAAYPVAAHPAWVLTVRTNTTLFWTVLILAAMAPQMLYHPALVPVLGLHVLTSLATLPTIVRVRKTA